MALTKEQSIKMASNIINNLDKFTVNREEKMNRSVDVLVQQRIIKKNNKRYESENDIASAMGYGNNNTKTGD